MRESFRQALVKAGVDVGKELFDGAERLVSRDLAYEVAYAKWGQAEARRRLNDADRQIEVAAELLRQANSPETLFRVAAERGSDAPRVAGPSGDHRVSGRLSRKVRPGSAGTPLLFDASPPFTGFRILPGGAAVRRSTGSDARDAHRASFAASCSGLHLGRRTNA